MVALDVAEPHDAVRVAELPEAAVRQVVRAIPPFGRPIEVVMGRFNAIPSAVVPARLRLAPSLATPAVEVVVVGAQVAGHPVRALALPIPTVPSRAGRVHQRPTAAIRLIEEVERPPRDATTREVIASKAVKAPVALAAAEADVGKLVAKLPISRAVGPLARRVTKVARPEERILAPLLAAKPRLAEGATSPITGPAELRPSPPIPSRAPLVTTVAAIARPSTPLRPLRVSMAASGAKLRARPIAASPKERLVPRTAVRVGPTSTRPWPTPTMTTSVVTAILALT